MRQMKTVLTVGPTTWAGHWDLGAANLYLGGISAQLKQSIDFDGLRLVNAEASVQRPQGCAGSAAIDGPSRPFSMYMYAGPP